MNIVFLLPGNSISGGVKRTAILGNILLKRGHAVRIKYLLPEGMKERIKKLWHAAILYGKKIDGLRQFEGEVEAVRDIDRCSFNRDEIIIGVGMWCSLQLGRIRHPVLARIQSLQGLTPWSEGIMDEALSMDMPKIVVSEHIARYIKQRYGRDVLAVIGNGVEEKDFYPQYEESQRDGIGTSYLNHPSKDPQVILRTIAELKRIHPRTPVYMFGGSRKPRRDAGLSYIRFATVEQARHMYSKSLVWLMLSRYEGFSLTLLEAMACGCAVVATKCGGPEQLIRDGENGFLVDAGDVNRIVAKTSLLLRDADLRKLLATNAGRVVEQYNWDRIAGEFERVLARSL